MARHYTVWDMNKILVVTEEGRGGGALGRIILVAKEIAQNYNTVVLCPQNATSFHKKLESTKVPYLTLNLHPLTTDKLGLFKYLIYFLSEVINIRKIVKKEKPDIVHANASWQIKAALATLGLPSKFVWHMNDMYQPQPISGLYKMCAAIPDAYIFASERTKAYYNSLSKRIKYKPHAVINAPVAMTEPIPSAQRSREGTIKLLTIGYINKWKGLDILIKTMSLLNAENIEWHVVGPILKTRQGYYRYLESVMQKYKSDKIKFLGYMKVDSALLDQYDYYVCTSIKEASPMAVWESMSKGLPIISTDVGDVKTIVDKYECGVVSTSFDPTELAQVILNTISQTDEDYKRMSTQSIKAAQENFLIDSVGEEYLKFYSRVIEGER
jgi:Glycosyltransferase